MASPTKSSILNPTAVAGTTSPADRALLRSAAAHRMRTLSPSARQTVFDSLFRSGLLRGSAARGIRGKR